jgi:hypothetical protein
VGKLGNGIRGEDWGDANGRTKLRLAALQSTTSRGNCQHDETSKNQTPYSLLPDFAHFWYISLNKLCDCERECWDVV